MFLELGSLLHKASYGGGLTVFFPLKTHDQRINYCYLPQPLIFSRTFVICRISVFIKPPYSAAMYDDFPYLDKSVFIARTCA